MQKTNFSNIVIVILIISNIFFAWKFLASEVTIKNLQTKIDSQKTNNQILLFTQLFMDKVLSGSKEVSFDDRLQLENSVRALNDKEVFDSWQTFTRASNQTQTQQDFYNLFKLLLKKITI